MDHSTPGKPIGQNRRSIAHLEWAILATCKVVSRRWGGRLNQLELRAETIIAMSRLHVARSRSAIARGCERRISGQLTLMRTGRLVAISRHTVLRIGRKFEQQPSHDKLVHVAQPPY